MNPSSPNSFSTIKIQSTPVKGKTMVITKLNENPIKFLTEIESDERYIKWDELNKCYLASADVPIQILDENGNHRTILERYTFAISKELYESLKNDSRVHWGDYGGYLVNAYVDLYERCLKNNAYTIGFHFQLLNYEPFKPKRATPVIVELQLDNETQNLIEEFDNSLPLGDLT